jgi:acetyl esterase/lipase
MIRWMVNATTNPEKETIKTRIVTRWLVICAAVLVCSGISAATSADAPQPAKTPAKPAAKSQSGPKPTLANVPYGTHPKQVLDFYKAESSTPTPLVFFIHGGGWMNGSKTPFNASQYLKAGISVVSIEYRFIPEATADKVVPPVKGPLSDAARALQFVRSKAKEWNIDKTRIGATGGSAGACSSLWLAFHDDMADPKSSDPIAQESTRLTCAAVSVAQTSLDPKQMKEWTPNSRYGGHAFGFTGDKKTGKSQFQEFLEGREKILPWIKEYSPYELVTSDDPPIFLSYSTPPALGQEQKDPTHTANFGVKLQEKCQSAGVECHLAYPGATDLQYHGVGEFLIAKLKGKTSEKQ